MHKQKETDLSMVMLRPLLQVILAASEEVARGVVQVLGFNR